MLCVYFTLLVVMARATLPSPHRPVVETEDPMPSPSRPIVARTSFPSPYRPRIGTPSLRRPAGFPPRKSEADRPITSTTTTETPLHALVIRYPLRAYRTRHVSPTVVPVLVKALSGNVTEVRVPESMTMGEFRVHLIHRFNYDKVFRPDAIHMSVHIVYPDNSVAELIYSGYKDANLAALLPLESVSSNATVLVELSIKEIAEVKLTEFLFSAIEQAFSGLPTVSE